MSWRCLIRYTYLYIENSIYHTRCLCVSCMLLGLPEFKNWLRSFVIHDISVISICLHVIILLRYYKNKNIIDISIYHRVSDVFVRFIDIGMSKVSEHQDLVGLRYWKFDIQCRYINCYVNYVDISIYSYDINKYRHIVKISVTILPTYWYIVWILSTHRYTVMMLSKYR